MILHWHPTGLRVAYVREFFEVHDLNPETKIRTRVSRLEMLRVGLRCIAAGIRGGSHD